jgi:hypothetical protein
MPRGIVHSNKLGGIKLFTKNENELLAGQSNENADPVGV